MLEYIQNDEVDIKLARMGHLAFYDSKAKQVLLFGGQIAGDKFKQSSERLLQNDIVVYDYKTNSLVEHITFSEGVV